MGAAGVIEVVAATGIAVGLATRLLAFIASGEMAVAYFYSHVRGSNSLWWWENRGEVTILYCFLWLYFAAAGAGPISVDRMREEVTRVMSFTLLGSQCSVRVQVRFCVLRSAFAVLNVAMLRRSVKHFDEAAAPNSVRGEHIVAAVAPYSVSLEALSAPSPATRPARARR